MTRRNIEFNAAHGFNNLADAAIEFGTGLRARVAVDRLLESTANLLLQRMTTSRRSLPKGLFHCFVEVADRNSTHDINASIAIIFAQSY